MSDLEQQIQVEQKRLAGISSLTDEMDDDSAQVLLEWAQAQIPKIAGDGSKLEDRAKKLRRLAQEINYFVGNVEGMSSEERQENLDRVYQASDSLNYPAQRELIDGVNDQLEGIPPEDVLVILLAWLEDDSLLVDYLTSEGSA